ncbi:hypothetical protein EYF80_058012 [Liparis tanakae]|uniref:Uncharacterized protein n=1 Tax=Liparis tanakae TaxID=230148 RepID=A0A4Z2ET73_9TELE|nr:hypothetical protein EYF80_058012 [Liparis tanakae]
MQLIRLWAVNGGLNGLNSVTFQMRGDWRVESDGERTNSPRLDTYTCLSEKPSSPTSTPPGQGDHAHQDGPEVTPHAPGAKGSCPRTRPHGLAEPGVEPSTPRPLMEDPRPLMEDGPLVPKRPDPFLVMWDQLC